MATKVASLYAEVTAKTDQASQSLGRLKGDLQATGSAMTGLATTAGLLAAAAGAAALTIKEACDFGAEGAAVIQIESSFQSLIATLGGAPDTLDQMSAAVRGTVSELELMSSASTLLIGTSGELGAAFADALPQLSAIAQAAHDVNPALGDTSFLFDSLARGIKRASPLILDNLGIVVKLEEVYKNYADTLGKTSDELTAEEKSMAVLNAVLQEGTTILEQAGRVSTSTADSFAKLEAATSNLGNAIKAKFAPGLAEAASSAYTLLTATDQLATALSAHSGDVLASAQTWTEYSTEMQRAARAAGGYIDASGDLVNSLGHTLVANYAMTKAEWELSFASKAATSGTQELSGGLSMLGEEAIVTSEAIEQVSEAAGMSDEALSAWSARLTGAAEAAGFTSTTMSEMAIMAVGLAAGLDGVLGSAMDNYQQSLESLQEEQASLTEQLVDLQERGYSPTSEKVSELTAALDENKEKQTEALENLQALTAEQIYNQAATGLETQAALDLASAMGLVSEADYAVATAVASLTAEYDKNKDGAISVAEGSQDYAAAVYQVSQAVQSLQAKNMPITLDNIAKEMEALAKAGASGELENTATAAEGGTEPLEDVAGAAEDAAGGAESLAGSAEDQNAALEAVKGAADSAKGGIDSVRGAATNAYAPLAKAATAARALSSALENVPDKTKITVTSSGFENAIAWVQKLTQALNNIPTNVQASISLSSTQASNGVPTPTGYSLGVPAPAVPTVSNTYNVYNPLAAAILVANQEQETSDRLGALMYV